MRPTFLGFETSRRGVIAAQKGLDITGHNLTNMNTAGYTRQRVDLVSIAPNSFRTRYASSRIDFTGQGAEITGVSQTRDQFLDKRFRDQYGEVGYYDKSTEILQDIESAITEKDDAGLGYVLKQITSALNTFSANASSETDANVVAVNFKTLTQLFHQMDTKLNSVAEQQRFDLSNAVDDANSIIQKIAQLNETIAEDIGVQRHTQSEYYGPNELMDQRNLLLDELSRYGDLEVTNLSNGSLTVKMNGKTVIDHKEYTKLVYGTNEDKGTVSLSWLDTGEPAQLTKGVLKASLEYINGRGPNVTAPDETATKGILYYKDKLNTLAQTLVNQMNNIIPDEGTGQKKQLLGARVQNANGDWVTTTSVPVTAGNISLSDAWLNDSTYVMYKYTGQGTVPIADSMKNAGISFVSSGDDFSGTGKVQYSISDAYTSGPPEKHTFTIKATMGGKTYTGAVDNLDNAQDVTLTNAAGGADDNFKINVPKIDDLVSGGLATANANAAYTFDAIEETDVEAQKTKDNTYILEMINVLSKNENIAFNANGDNFTGTFSQFITDYNTVFATDANYNLNRLEATAAIADELNNRRDSVSGVSEVEETTNMMMYSKSFQAAARMMTTMDEALDVIINKTGLVGR